MSAGGSALVHYEVRRCKIDFQRSKAYFMTTEKPVAWNYYLGWEAVDVAQIILDTGLRPEEVFRIRIENLDFGEKKIFNPFGKTKTARRKVTMTVEVAEILERRAKKAKSPFVFPSKGNLEGPIGNVRKAHDAAVEKAGIKEHFRLYDLRHTYGIVEAMEKSRQATTISTSVQ